MEGMRVFRSMLRTSVAMQKSFQSSHTDGVLCAVSGYAWYAEEARSFLQERGWSITDDVRKQGVSVMLSPHKDVQWDMVLRGDAAACHYFAKNGLIRRVDLCMALEGKGTRRATMPLTITKRISGQCGEEVDQACALLAGGLPWRVSPSAAGGGWGSAVVCSKESDIKDMLGVKGGGNWLLQQHVELKGELEDLKGLEIRIPVIAAGSLHVYAHTKPLAYCARPSPFTSMMDRNTTGGFDGVPLTKVAIFAGDDELASEWLSRAHVCISRAFEAAAGAGPKGGLLPMHNTFELLCFTFLVGEIGGGGDAGGGPWLVKVETAMDAEDPFLGMHRGNLVKKVLQLALCHVTVPGAGQQANLSAGEEEFSLVYTYAP